MTAPSVAVAAAICWLARQPGLPGHTLRQNVVERHPTTCDWCDWPAEDLLRMVDEMEPTEVVRFARLSRGEQRRLVNEAQGGVLI